MGVVAAKAVDLVVPIGAESGCRWDDVKLPSSVRSSGKFPWNVVHSSVSARAVPGSAENLALPHCEDRTSLRGHGRTSTAPISGRVRGGWCFVGVFLLSTPRARGRGGGRRRRSCGRWSGGGGGGPGAVPADDKPPSGRGLHSGRVGWWDWVLAGVRGATGVTVGWRSGQISKFWSRDDEIAVRSPRRGDRSEPAGPDLPEPPSLTPVAERR